MSDDPMIIDWRNEWLAEHPGAHLSVLVEIGGELSPEDEEDEENFLTGIRTDLQAITVDDSLAVAIIDPYVGAGGYGLAAIWGALGNLADLVALATFAKQVAPRVRQVAARLADRFRVGGTAATVYFGADTIRILVLAEVLIEQRLTPFDVVALDIIHHNYPPVEPAIEKQQLYSAFTVTVMAVRGDGFYTVWNYLVTCHGIVVSASSVKLPIPNATHWSDVTLPDRRLRGVD